MSGKGGGVVWCLMVVHSAGKDFPVTEQRDPAELSQEEAAEAEPSTDDVVEHLHEAPEAPEAGQAVDAPPVEGDPVERALDEGMPVIAEPEPEALPEPEPEPEPEPAPEPEPEPEPAPESEPEPEPEPEHAAETLVVPVPAPAAQPTAVITRPQSVATPTAPPENDAHSAPSDAIFRDSPSEPEGREALSDEEQKLAAERAARREARLVALAATAPAPVVPPAPVVIHKRTNDKFLGSLGLFVLRLVVAGIFAVRGLNIVTDLPAAQEMIAKTIIPEPYVMAIVLGVASLLIALALLLGVLTRLAGVGVIAIAGGALAFVMWGDWNIFLPGNPDPGQPAFLGEFELLLATVGLAFICLGAGGWSLDRSYRAGRERGKAERAGSGQAQ